MNLNEIQIRKTKEILFRAWNKKTKKLIFFSLTTVPTTIINNPKKWKIMQWTTQKDKNKRRIYEGDIVIIEEVNTNSENIPGNTGVIEWLEQGCEYWITMIWAKDKKSCWNNEFFRLKGNNWTEVDPMDPVESTLDCNRLKIIGNIYQDKKLLKLN